MSTQRKKRAEKRAESKNPFNFTCGVCGKVHGYTEGYVCPEEEVNSSGPLEEE